MSKYKKMKQLIADMRLPEYRYKQLLDAVFLQGIMRFEDMKLLPKTLREKLVEQFGETVVEIKAIHHEKSMQTDKVLFELSDGNRVETVGLFYKEGWNSFCISSQSGCGFGCKFCATGTLGLRRNLTVDEITDQILYFMQQGCSINSISFMGMGEPFANPQVFEALHDLTAPELFGLSQRRITISTIGIVPGIQKLTREYPQVNLAYSLHAPTDRLRETLMPITKTYPLGQVLDTLDQHIRQTNRKVFLAYIMLKDVNDSDRHAEQLTGNVKKCAVGKYPKSEKHGNTAQFSEVERSGTQENCGGIGSGCRLRLRPLPVLRRRQSQRVARIDPNAVVVDKNIAENDRFDLFSR